MLHSRTKLQKPNIMKKLSLSILMILLVLNVRAQFLCSFTYSNNPGTNVVSFQPDSTHSPNLYHFVWDFGDGTSDSSYNPTHIYNTPLPVYACCYVYDSLNFLACSSCDSIGYNISPPTCTFTINTTSAPNVVIGQVQSIPNAIVQWDMGDGATASGNNITYTYAMPGLYMVCVTQVDGTTGAVICYSCSTVTIIPSGSNCNFTYNSVPNSNTIVFASSIPFSSNVYWDFGDSTSSTGSNQVSHTFPGSGIYQVCIYVTDSTGATCSYCDYVNVGSSQGNCLFSFAPVVLQDRKRHV